MNIRFCYTQVRSKWNSLGHTVANSFTSSAIHCNSIIKYPILHGFAGEQMYMCVPWLTQQQAQSWQRGSRSVHFDLKSTWAWQLPSIFQTLPSLLQGLGIFFVPESPRVRTSILFKLTKPFLVLFLYSHLVLAPKQFPLLSNQPPQNLTSTTYTNSSLFKWLVSKGRDQAAVKSRDIVMDFL